MDNNKNDLFLSDFMFYLMYVHYRVKSLQLVMSSFVIS